MWYGMTITALVSGVALLAATQLPAKAGPIPDLKSTIGMVQLVKGGGGGGGGGAWGGGGGSFSGGGGHMGGGGGGHMMGGGGGPSGHFASVGAGHMGRMGGDHFSSGAWGGSRSARIARGGNFNGPSVRHGHIASNNWNGNWDHHHNHHFNNRFFFTGGSFFYGDYYAYGYGNCAWLRRQAIITGSPYWWSRYQACLYY